MDRVKIDALALWVTALAAAWIAVSASAQTAPAPAAPAPSAPAQTAPQKAAPTSAASALDQFAWLRGCWAGKVERFEFAENWLPARGGMMVGIGQSIARDRKSSETKTQDFQYLRLEERADGVYYVAVPSGKEGVCVQAHFGRRGAWAPGVQLHEERRRISAADRVHARQGRLAFRQGFGKDRQPGASD